MRFSVTLISHRRQYSSNLLSLLAAPERSQRSLTMSKPLHDPLSKALDEGSRIEVKNTTCYMCACRCGIRVTLRDGEVRYIQGNPDHPLNKGVICAKGSSGIRLSTSHAPAM